MEDKRFTKHGFPKGYRFVPTDLELITILSHKIAGRRLHHKVAGIFHELSILEYHPKELHGIHEHDKEHNYIYFFSYRQFQKTSGGDPVHKKRQRGAAGGQDEDDNEPRPVRMAKGGGWKPSGGGRVLHWPKDKGGFVAGKMVTMVFYDRGHDGKQCKSQWGMHEFTVPVDQRDLSKPEKIRHWHGLALYRLYKLKGDAMESDDGAGSNLQTLTNVSAADGYFSAPPSFGILTGRNQALAAGASTQLQQHHIPNVGHPQYYHHHQYVFGSAPASAAHQRVPTPTMTMPPAYGTGMPCPRFPFPRPPGTGLPLHGHQSLQFARPPAPSQMPVPLAAANPSSHQAPTKPATYGGAGQEASHFGATRTPPAAADSPWAEELAPMTATHGGAGQEASGNFEATRSSQDAAATAETGQHAMFADCANPEERMPPLIDGNDGMGMPEWDFDLGCMYEDEDDERFLFTIYELLCPSPPIDEPPPTQEEDNKE